ncbi:hypothetical protein B0H13DRAFT_2322629 [Mycena leptocephala]|nr:hypothetical protein B0H13DRAFT_2322629 [Mycena leptocephala]
MPATRHARREGRGGYNPLALPALPAIPSFFSSTTSNGTAQSPSTSDSTATLTNSDTDPRKATRGLDSSRLLQSISSSMDLETIQIVASSCALLFDTVLIVRTNRTQCRQLLERVHQIVRALINLCGDAQKNREGGPGVGLNPEMARAIEKFTGTLAALHTILQAQASAGLMSRILKHAETRDQLQACEVELQQALDVFGVQTGLMTHTALGGARRAAADRHAEILQALRQKRFGGAA